MLTGKEKKFQTVSRGILDDRFAYSGNYYTPHHRNRYGWKKPVKKIQSINFGLSVHEKHFRKNMQISPRQLFEKFTIKNPHIISSIVAFKNQKILYPLSDSSKIKKKKNKIAWLNESGPFGYTSGTDARLQSYVTAESEDRRRRRLRWWRR